MYSLVNEPGCVKIPPFVAGTPGFPIEKMRFRGGDAKDKWRRVDGLLVVDHEAGIAQLSSP